MATDYVARFWRKVDKSGECWVWAGARNEGYGLIWIAGRLHRCHRIAWELTHGPIPPGLLVCHHCDNPSCVRPDHLFLGTSADNKADCMAKGRNNNPCVKLTADQVRAIKAQLATGVSCAAVARQYEVDPTTISAIRRNETWAHI